MSLDRIVYFAKRKPSLKELRCLLEDYLAGAGTIDFSKASEQARWYVVLPGKPSFPFRRVSKIGEEHQKLHYEMPERPDRWFEVVFCSLKQKKKPNIDIITRTQDEYTNVVARGFAELVRRYYEATLDE